MIVQLWCSKLFQYCQQAKTMQSSGSPNDCDRLCTLSRQVTWASEGGGAGEAQAPLLDFEIISKKRLFFQFLGVKNKFHRFWPPLEKILGKSPTGPPGKNPSDARVIKYNNTRNRIKPT